MVSLYFFFHWPYLVTHGLFVLLCCELYPHNYVFTIFFFCSSVLLYFLCNRILIKIYQFCSHFFGLIVLTALLNQVKSQQSFRRHRQNGQIFIIHCVLSQQFPITVIAFITSIHFVPLSFSLFIFILESFFFVRCRCLKQFENRQSFSFSLEISFGSSIWMA